MAKELESYKKAVKELASKDDDKEDKHFTEDEQEEIYQEIARNYDSEIEQATKDQPIDYTSFTTHDSFMDAVNENRNFIKQAISEPIEDADIDKTILSVRMSSPMKSITMTTLRPRSNCFYLTIACLLMRIGILSKNRRR